MKRIFFSLALWLSLICYARSFEIIKTLEAKDPVALRLVKITQAFLDVNISASEGAFVNPKKISEATSEEKLRHERDYFFSALNKIQILNPAIQVVQEHPGGELLFVVKVKAKDSAKKTVYFIFAYGIVENERFILDDVDPVPEAELKRKNLL